MLEGLVVGIDHVGVCIPEMEPAAELWSGLLGLAVAHRECVDAQRTEAAFVDPPGGGTTLELVSPMSGNPGLERFLEKRGPGLHHVAFAVTDIGESLARLRQAGVALIDEAPRPGARGHLVAFLHPRAAGGVLVELVQRSKGRS
ncbi:MAG: methylmalonyl-CoA epimerase [Deltaproteobacteria bacterium]|nr:methylmalonyl-CoA epimerase [Deltaproteobacteria bacterium]